MPSFLSSEPTTPKEMNPPTVVVEERLQRYLKTDQERDKWLKELIQENRKLKKSVKLTEGLENQVEDLTESLKRRIENYEEKKERLRVAEESAAANPFAVVLVDGDGYVFPDDLLCQGTSGGEEAAQRLLTEATKYLERYKGAKDWKLIVRIFVNLEGLARKCQQFDIIKQSNTLREFATGFAQSQPLFDFVDVGYGKERADHKIRENFTLFVRDMHCKHILFGCCHDNGYIPSLDSWKNNSTVASQISLIQHYQLGEGYKKLPFDIAELSSVFRHAELLPSKGSGSPLSHLSHVPFSIPTQPVGHNRSASMPGRDFSTSAGEVMQTSANGTLKRPRTPSNDKSRNRPIYAQDNATAPEASLPCDPRLHNVNPTTNATSNSQTVPIQESDLKNPCRVFLNSVGQRIDQPLVKPSADVYKRLDDRCQRLPWPHKFCNMHHIKGVCTHGNCQYSHAFLEPDEVLVLAIRARQMVCKFGSACTYRLCFLGHHCSHDPNCHYRICRFANFHGIDRRMTHVLLDGAESSKRQKVSHDG